MTTYTPLTKNSPPGLTPYRSVSKTKLGAGNVFFGWMFLFTNAGDPTFVGTAPSKNVTSYSTINKN